MWVQRRGKPWPQHIPWPQHKSWPQHIPWPLSWPHIALPGLSYLSVHTVFCLFLKANMYFSFPGHVPELRAKVPVQDGGATILQHWAVQPYVWWVLQYSTTLWSGAAMYVSHNYEGVRWLNGEGIVLVIWRSPVRFPAMPNDVASKALHRICLGGNVPVLTVSRSG